MQPHPCPCCPWASLLGTGFMKPEVAAVGLSEERFAKPSSAHTRGPDLGSRAWHMAIGHFCPSAQ